MGFKLVIYGRFELFEGREIPLLAEGRQHLQLVGEGFCRKFVQYELGNALLGLELGRYIGIVAQLPGDKEFADKGFPGEIVLGSERKTGRFFAIAGVQDQRTVLGA